MISMQQHLEQNRAAIKAEAREYAKNCGVSLELATREVEDEYRQGWCEAADARRTGDWETE